MRPPVARYVRLYVRVFSLCSIGSRIRASTAGGDDRCIVCTIWANGAIRKGGARRMEKGVPKRQWRRGGGGWRDRGQGRTTRGRDDERRAARTDRKQTAPAGHFEAFAKNASYMGKDGLTSIRTKNRGDGR